jgi:hypothetical protein
LNRLKMISPLSGDAIVMIVVMVVLYVISWFQMTVPIKAIEVRLDNIDVRLDNIDFRLDRLEKTTIKKFW